MHGKQDAIMAAAAVWGGDTAGVLASDISAKLPWCQRHRLWLCANPKREKLLVAVDEAGRTTAFGRAEGAGGEAERVTRLKCLNELLQAEGKSLPHGMAPTLLAETVRLCLGEPGGWVGSSAFWAEQDVQPPPGHSGPAPFNPMDMWVTHRPEDGRELFQRHCADPTLRASDEEWELSFSYFNLRGGVERWTLTGDATTVRSAGGSEALSNGTFLPPFV